MKSPAKITGITLSIFAVISAFTLPVKVHKTECLTTRGLVVSVWRDTPAQNISFRLKGSEDGFYITDGLAAGLNEQTLRKKILNKVVTIWYNRNWIQIGPYGKKTKSIARVVAGNEVIYSEM